jgi:ketosteroid isomerase-like protein
MPQHVEALVGSEELRVGYRQLFSVLKYNLTFEIAETVILSSEWAFVRSITTGTADILGKGLVLESNKELFVIQKVSGEWLISRYCMNTSQPQPQ